MRVIVRQVDGVLAGPADDVRDDVGVDDAEGAAARAQGDVQLIHPGHTAERDAAGHAEAAHPGGGQCAVPRSRGATVTHIQDGDPFTCERQGTLDLIERVFDRDRVAAGLPRLLGVHYRRAARALDGDHVVANTCPDRCGRSTSGGSDGEGVGGGTEGDIDLAESTVGDGVSEAGHHRAGQIAGHRARSLAHLQGVHPGAALDIDRQRRSVVKCQRVVAGAKVAGNGHDAVVGLAIRGSGESRVDPHLVAGLFGQGVALVAHPGADIAPAGEGTHVECQLSSIVIPRGKPRRFIGEDTSWDSDRSNRPTAAYVAKKRTKTSLGPQ